MWKSTLRSFIRFRSRDGGQALWFVAALIAMVGGAVAIGVDIGSYATNRRNLQNAADAIALAASLDLPDAAAAQAAANQWATKNGINPASMTVTIIPQSLPNEPNPKVRVSLTRSHSFTFARLVGVTSATVQASAAGIKTSPGGSAGLVPWSVKEEVKALASPGDQVVLKYDSNNGVNGNFAALAIDG